MQRETLNDGAVRLRGAHATYLYTRFVPGALLVTHRGRVGGDPGRAEFDEIDAEMDRFGAPLAFCMDTTATEAVADGAVEAWAAWFASRRARLARVEFLARPGLFELLAASAKHFSRTGELIRVHTDAARFDAAIAAIAPGARRPAPERMSEPAVSVRRALGPGGTISFSAPGCSFSLSRLGEGALLVVIAGADRGQLGPDTFDEVMRALAAIGQPSTLFIDLRGAISAADGVQACWTAWFAANRARLKRVSIVVPSHALHFMVAMAKRQSRTDELIVIHDDPEAFEQAARKFAPGFSLPPQVEAHRT
jgi:hypothetical protein